MVMVLVLLACLSACVRTCICVFLWLLAAELFLSSFVLIVVFYCCTWMILAGTVITSLGKRKMVALLLFDL